jgi:hypothetical protein
MAQISQMNVWPPRLLKSVARLLGAKQVDVLYIGMACVDQQQALPARVKAKARRLGVKLAAARQP